MKKHLLAVSLLLSSLATFGSGYQLNLEGLREMAMGGTGAGMPWDASTIFYNPGGLARINNIQVYASVAFVSPSTAYSNATSTGNSAVASVKTNPSLFTPVNFYIGGQVHANSKLAVGLGVYEPYGTGLQWDNNWMGSAIVQEVKLTTVFIQPTISYRVSDFFSVGAGFIFADGSLDFRQSLPVQFMNPPYTYGSYNSSVSTNGEAHMYGNGTGVGFNLGMHFKFSDRIQVGLTYRSQVNLDVNGGAADFVVPPSLASQFPNTRFDSQVPLPEVATIGIAVKPDAEERLTIQFDLNFTGWNSFDSLRFNFFTQTTSLQNMHEPMLYRNTVTPRLGLCYKVSKVVSLMAGGAYDPTPVTDGNVSPVLPDADRIIVTCGLTVKPIHRLTLMAAFESTNSVKRNATYNYDNFSGEYQTKAITFGLGLYYNL